MIAHSCNVKQHRKESDLSFPEGCSSNNSNSSNASNNSTNSNNSHDTSNHRNNAWARVGVGGDPYTKIIIITSYHNVSCYIVWYYINSYGIIMLCYIVVYYVIVFMSLYCISLSTSGSGRQPCYAILYYTTLSLSLSIYIYIYLCAKLWYPIVYYTILETWP